MASIGDVSDRELLAYMRGVLAADRRREIDRLLMTRPDVALRLDALCSASGIEGGANRDDDVDEFSDLDAGVTSQIATAVAAATQTRQFRALRDDIRAGRVVVFAGPGLSRAVGIADREDLCTALATRIAGRLRADAPAEIERLKHLGLQSLSELFIHHFGHPRLTQVMTEVTYSRFIDGTKLDLHKMILEIPFAMIVSTNWDDLFEQAGRQLDPPVHLNSITTDDELLGLYTPYGPMLIQPRGSLRKGNAVVEEHAGPSHERRHPGLCAFLRTLFFTHKILFVGFSDRDAGLIYYYRLLESQLGDLAREVCAQSYIFASLMARAGSERFHQMGFRIIDCPLADVSATMAENSRWPQICDTVATRHFLRTLVAETRPEVNRLQRSKRIADFLSESECLHQDFRGRAGLSPIGLPDKRQLAEDRWAIMPPYLSVAAEYDEQERMKNGFLQAVNRAVVSGHEVKFILSTEFESIQDRATNKKWVRLQLQNLVDFFGSGIGKQTRVKVVDRHGPFEMQQYILGEGELAESVKLDVHDPTYFHARTTKDPRAARAAKRLFDVCFTGLASRNLENLLSVYNDPGRNYLVNRVCEALCQGNLEPVLKDVKAIDPLAAKLIDELRSTLDAVDRDPLVLHGNVETSLATSPPHIVMSVLSEEVVFQAIKEHLIAQWKHETDMLGETRPGWIIQLARRDGEGKGELEKDTCHRNLYGELESELYNLHVAAFALTADARRLILRKRRDDGPYFDPGKWDRTVTGHVRKDSTFSREFINEVSDHFEHCGVRGCSFVTRGQFMEISRRRARQSAPPDGAARTPSHGMEIIAFPVYAEPLPHVHRRSRAADGKPVLESARSMLYLCIMPRPELPREDPSGKHFADWVEVPLDKIRQMLTTNSPIDCAAASGTTVQIGRDTMTDEAWKLLEMCYRDVLAHLQATGQ